MLVSLDPADRRPKTRQIVAKVQSLIQTGALKAGEALPSTRALAEHLELHRATVAAAYQELWSLGWLDLRPGALPRVRSRAALAPVPAREEPGPGWWDALAPLDPRLLRPMPLPRDPAVISFISLGMDPRLMPVAAFGRSLQSALRRHGAALLDYDEPQGYAPLRASLARTLRQHAITVGPEEILVTHGAQQGLDLVLKGLARPGGAVVVEAPTYDQFLPLLALRGLEAIPVPMTATGLDLDRLAQVLADRRPLLVYTMPSFQNPTGRCTTQAHRERLLDLCEAAGVPILEDAFEEEMKYFGRPILPIKSMDQGGMVIYAGTFSKVLFPGLRIGWVAAKAPFIRHLAGLRRAGEICPAPLLQAALEDFLEKGRYSLHLARLHRVLRRRMALAIRVLRRVVSPAWAIWEPPAGGYLLWLELAPPPQAVAWEEHFRQHGVGVVLGDRYFPGTPTGPCLRLSISNLDEAEIEAGLERLGRALHTIYAAKEGALP